MSVAIAAVAVAASCAAPPAAAFFVPAALFANRATAHSCWGFAGSLKRTRNGLLLRGGGTSIVQAGRLSSSAMALATDHPRQTAEPSAQVRWLTPPGVRVILGSSSFTRKLLLKEMGVDYEIQSPDIDEKAIRDEDPQVLVEALANAKADALLERLATVQKDVEETSCTLLITSDQVVVHDGQIREKPVDEDQAREFLRGYGNAPCRTVGAIAVTNLASSKRVMALDTAAIHFSPFPDAIVETLIADPMTYKCAGGLMVEDERIQPYILKIEGGMDSVMGLGRRTMLSLLDRALDA